jgi:hypothetical protein
MAPDGLALVSYALSRTPSDVLARADVLGVHISDDWRQRPLRGTEGKADDRVLYELHGGLVCPCCGKGTVIPWSYVGETYGVCETCHRKAQAAAKADEAAEIAYRRRYNANRRRAERERAKMKKKR